jgi:hypothetical protein
MIRSASFEKKVVTLQLGWRIWLPQANSFWQNLFMEKSDLIIKKHTNTSTVSLQREALTLSYFTKTTVIRKVCVLSFKAKPMLC